MAHLYRKKPVVVEARQFRGGEENGKQICLWMNRERDDAKAGWAPAQPANKDAFGNIRAAEPEIIVFNQPTGPYAVNVSDWVIHTVEGYFITCSAGAFPNIYEKI